MMKTYMIEWTQDKCTNRKTLLVTAADYTKAYLKACFTLPFDAEIIEVTEAN